MKSESYQIFACGEYLLVPVLPEHGEQDVQDVMDRRYRIARLIAEERWEIDSEIFDNFDEALARVPRIS
jgi:hypothetical protein